jgi:hypothetical protein
LASTNWARFSFSCGGIGHVLVLKLVKPTKISSRTTPQPRVNQRLVLQAQSQVAIP